MGRFTRWVGFVALATGCASGAKGEDSGTTAGSGGSTTTTGTTSSTTGSPTTGSTTSSGSSTSTSITSGSSGSTTTEAPTSSTSTTTTGVPGGCAPVTTETFTLEQDVLLNCGAMAAVDVFDQQLSHRGGAAARATVIIEHTQNTPVIHFWNATVLVGESSYGFGIGDDVCSGYQPASKTNLGVGVLTDAADHVKVPMYQGSAPCTDGALKVKAGSTLELWYEDGDPRCAGKSIAWTSWYATQGYETTYVWQTMMAEILALPVEVPEGSSALVLSVVEGSPDTNPNSMCGAETQTLVSQIVADGAILAQAEGLLPASGGQGHLVLSSQAPLMEAGAHSVQLLVGANVFNSPVRTGGCCGDAALLAIVQTP